MRVDRVFVFIKGDFSLECALERQYVQAMTKKPQIYACTNLRIGGRSCAGQAHGQALGQGAFDVIKALRLAAARTGDAVDVKDSVCMGYCQDGPNVKVLGGSFHHGVTPEDAQSIIDEALALIDKGQG